MLKCMASTDVFTILKGERAYQARRWGMRQPDGTMHEHVRAVADYVIFLRDYYEEAQRCYSREVGTRPVSHGLRKLVALALACLEQNDSYDGRSVSLDDLLDTFRRAGRIVPHNARYAGYSYYMLRMKNCIDDAEKYVVAANNSMALLYIRDMAQIGCELFELFGVAARDDRPVTNARDNQPA